jgi:hypothetical protein
MKKLFSCLLIFSMLISLGGCRTELDNAVAIDDITTVKRLLSEGANVNGTDPDHFSPLHYAALYGKTESAQLLVEKGANINIKSETYGTPLIVATYYGHKDFVKFLLEKGANTAITDAEGKTALNYAEEYQFTEIARMLKASSLTPPAVKAAPVAEQGGTGDSVQQAVKAAPAVEQGGAGDSIQPKTVPVAEKSQPKASKVNMAVFTFESANVEASSYSLEIANLLINKLKTIAFVRLTDRRDLEDFLNDNDLRQNNNLENIIQIGSSLGLGYIISGSVQKKDSMFIAHCQLINIGEKKVILSQVIRAFGEANMEKEVAKFGDNVIQAISR